MVINGVGEHWVWVLLLRSSFSLGHVNLKALKLGGTPLGSYRRKRNAFSPMLSGCKAGIWERCRAVLPAGLCRAGGRSVQGAVLPLPVRRGRRQRLAGPITPEEEEAEEAEGP